MFNVKSKDEDVFDRLAKMEKTLIGRKKGVGPLTDFEGLKDEWWQKMLELPRYPPHIQHGSLRKVMENQDIYLRVEGEKLFEEIMHEHQNVIDLRGNPYVTKDFI